jgi:hypothetical protein
MTDRELEFSELVVDNRALGPIEEALNRRQLQASRIDQIEALNLALLRLPKDRLAGYAIGARRDHVNEIRLLDDRAGSKITDLDVLLYDLRLQAARAPGPSGGLVPAMGKNRDAALVNPQGTGDPLPVPVGQAGADSKAGADPDPAVVRPIPDEPWGQGIRVGVIDVPLVPGHKDLVGVEAVPEDVAPPQDLTLWSGHANFVVGLIRRQAPQAEILVRPALSATDGSGTTWDVARQLAGFIDDHISVLNLSFGVQTEDDEPPFALRRAFERLGDGVLVVASAGNWASQPSPPHATWPAALTNVVAVGAATEFGSHFSPRRLWVDATAPGVKVGSTYLGSPDLPVDVELAAGDKASFTGWATWSGTSFAAATATGAIAAQMTIGGSKDPRAALQELLASGPGDLPGRSPVQRYVHIPV